MFIINMEKYKKDIQHYHLSSDKRGAKKAIVEEDAQDHKDRDHHE
jgi:hypothetical protein